MVLLIHAICDKHLGTDNRKHLHRKYEQGREEEQQ